MPAYKNTTKSERYSADVKHTSDLLPYPIDMSELLPLSLITLDGAGVPYSANPAGYHPTIIAQYALTCWNQYLATNDESHLKAFLAQARWLAEHESRIGKDAGGWPISFPHPAIHSEGLRLSALTQGHSISVLLRAYLLTSEQTFLEVARRAVRTFEADILDGGVSAPVGEEGIFFEEVAVYPAAHQLSGFIFALFGLYDYVALTGNAEIEKLIDRSLVTMHRLLGEFDVGYWTRPDLLFRRLTSPSHLALQAALLEVLSGYSGCDHCALLASRWKSYQRSFRTRLCYFIDSRYHSYGRALLNRARTVLFPRSQNTPAIHVCVPITRFPFLGGIRTVLANVAQVTKDRWQIEYVTQRIGPDPERFVVSRFGTTITSPWQFPFVWLYCLAGFGKLISMMHHVAKYHVILPQDGVFTAAFAALAGKLAGVRVVCIDHGNLTRLKSRIYRDECIQALATQPWPRRLLERMLYAWYWPSLSLLARISVRFVDHFLIPGVPGDGVEEICRSLAVPMSRITRFASMIDMDRHVVFDAASKADLRSKSGIATDAIVIAMICRLNLEKGLNIALEAISQALSALSPTMQERVRVIIAGDGPLREDIEAETLRRGLSQMFLLWGEATGSEVISLLGLSDIFLYTSTRGACFSMAVLEAMASGCAVIASTEPLSNAHLLAEGRGIAVPPGDAAQTSGALGRLLSDIGLCRRMGDLARDYIAVHHSPVMFRRALMRVTYWSGLEEFLNIGMEDEN